MDIHQLSAAHERDSFDCGEASLNAYLSKFARQNDDKGLGRTFVATEPGSLVVRGYYTLSSGAVKFDAVPFNLPKYPVPVVHLGRLAVDLKAQGQRLGETLLLDALRRAEQVSSQIGIHAVEVRALHDKARSFYLKYGFTALLDDPHHLYLPMKTIRKLHLNTAA